MSLVNPILGDRFGRLCLEDYGSGIKSAIPSKMPLELAQTTVRLLVKLTKASLLYCNSKFSGYYS
jgi:hypothetical protein